MTRKRQIEKQEAVRRKILDTAQDIISKNGVEGLSIRKITDKLDYSPGIIYHYFKDKNEIIETLAFEGYQNILMSLGKKENISDNPVDEIRNLFTSYIEAVLQNGEAYKAFILSTDPNILKRTSVLEQGIAKKSKSFALLTNTLKKGIEQGLFNSYDTELTAQILWTAAFGLVMRLITEKETSDAQRKRLIEHHFTIILNGILK